MIAESDVGIQLKLSTFKVDYGDLIIGDLGILKKLIFSYSKQLLRNNISVLLMVTKFNLLFGYLIWMHQFILGNVYANMFNSGHYVILNLLLLFIFIDRSMFRLVDENSPRSKGQLRKAVSQIPSDLSPTDQESPQKVNRINLNTPKAPRKGF